MHIVVAGGGGFIGGHLVSALLAEGHRVTAVDRKPLDEWQQVFDAAENIVADLSHPDSAARAVRGADVVYQLAADMGGMGFISKHHARILANNSLINIHTLDAA